jgi:hypothetical protein
MPHKIVFWLMPIMLLTACSTWNIALDKAGKQVYTAWDDDVSSCQELGRITVTVMDPMRPFERDDIKVRDELEVLARNQAAELHANTVKPLAEPEGDAQLWGAYRCDSRGLQPQHLSPAQRGVQTYPVKGS